VHGIKEGPPRIAVSSLRDDSFGVFVMNPDGSGQPRLTSNTSNGLTPAWSPDGSKIAFFSDRDGNYEIYMMKSDGTGQTRITTNPEYDGHPTWSRNGSKFMLEEFPSQIYVMNPDGSRQTRISHASWVLDEFVAWGISTASRGDYVASRSDNSRCWI